MASTYSPLKVELIGTGEQAGTWGTTTNTNLGTALEEAITGRATATFPSDANYTLPYTDTNGSQVFRNLVLNVTSSGSLGATRDLIIPAIEKQYIVENNTSGGQSIRIKTAAGTGVTISNGKVAHVYCNGTDTRFADDFVGITGGSIANVSISNSSLSLSAPLPVTSGGTGLATATQGDIIYASASNTYVALPKNTTATRYLSNTGTTNNPAWAQIDLTNGVVNTLPVASGGTGIVTFDQGDIIYASALNTLAKLTKNTTATRYLSNTGTSNNPAWSQIDLTNGVVNTLPVNRGGTGVATVTSGALLLGAGTSAFTTLTGTVTGQVVSWNNSTATWEVGTVSSGVSSFSAGTTGLTPSTGTTGAVTLGGTLGVSNGGTGQTSYTNGQLLIGNSTGGTLSKGTLTEGNGISITNGAGSITIASTLTVGPNAQVFSSSGTFTIPSGVTKLKVTVVGGGGGGSSGTSGGCASSHGAGGGGGGAAIKWLTVTGGTLSVTVGSGGAANNSGGTSSVASGTQSITTISATGGAQGTTTGGSPTPGGAGGLGSNGDLNIKGSGGISGIISIYGLAGGGGSSIFGGGAQSPGGAGVAGGAYGGGGSGGNIGQSPGAGAAGVVIIEW